MLLLRSKRWDLIILVASLFVWNLVYAIHIGTTLVKFTRTGFEAQLSWFRELHEPYDRVLRITGKPRTLTIHFSDGRSLKLHSGLGDPNTIISLLQARCPEAVELE